MRCGSLGVGSGRGVAVSGTGTGWSGSSGPQMTSKSSARPAHRGPSQPRTLELTSRLTDVILVNSQFPDNPPRVRATHPHIRAALQAPTSTNSDISQELQPGQLLIHFLPASVSVSLSFARPLLNSLPSTVCSRPHCPQTSLRKDATSIRHPGPTTAMESAASAQQSSSVGASWGAFLKVCSCPPSLLQAKSNARWSGTRHLARCD